MNDEPIDTLNVIPFVDIMLVLFTTVLTTASFISTGRIRSLRRRPRRPRPASSDKTIELTAAGATYFDGEPVTKDMLLTAPAEVLPQTTTMDIADQSATRAANGVIWASFYRWRRAGERG